MANNCRSCRARDPAGPRVQGTDETSPLLAHVDGPNSPPPERAGDDLENQPYIEETYDHPVFLRVCHSAFIGQQVLVNIRGVITFYSLVATFMILDFKIEWQRPYHSPLTILFDFPLLSWMVLFIYQIIALMWTYTHCYMPPTLESDASLFTRCIGVPSGGRLTSLTGQFMFTVFYFQVLTWSALNTGSWLFDTKFDMTMYPKPNTSSDGIAPRLGSRTDEIQPAYLASLASNNSATAYPSFDVVFGDDWFTTFTYINLLIIGSAICLVEATLLNQIKRPIMPWWTLFIITVETSLFAAWGLAGVAITRHEWYAFRWMKFEAVGSRFWIVMSGVGFIVAAAVAYAFWVLTVWVRSELDDVISMDDDEDEMPDDNEDEANRVRQGSGSNEQ